MIEDSRRYSELTRGITPAVHDAAATVKKFADRVRAIEQRLIEAERAVLQPLAQESVELRLVPPTYRGNAVPAPRWLVIFRNPNGAADDAQLKPALACGGADLHGRVLVGRAFSRGPIVPGLSVWFGDRGWAESDPLDDPQALGDAPPPQVLHDVNAVLVSRWFN